VTRTFEVRCLLHQ